MLKTNINAKIKQINNCEKQTLMPKMIINAKNKLTNDCEKQTLMPRAIIINVKDKDKC